jgi:hypothetical protein
MGTIKGKQPNEGSEMFEVSAVSDLFNAGPTEDGREFHAELYYVQAEAADGRRFAHFATFKGAERVEDGETGCVYFEDNREAASAKAEALAAKVRTHLETGGKLDPAHWREVDPAYGSDAYAELDAVGFFKAREKAEDR